jgi:hypothetical protein
LDGEQAVVGINKQTPSARSHIEQLPVGALPDRCEGLSTFHSRLCTIRTEVLKPRNSK